MADEGSCDPMNDLWVAFWAATTLNGRPPRDLGRCCHDRVPDRARAAAGLVSVSSGESFSLVGDVEFAIVSAGSSTSTSAAAAGGRVGSGVFSLDAAGDSSFNASERWMLRRLARGDGVFAGDDFCGEMDLARSEGAS